MFASRIFASSYLIGSVLSSSSEMFPMSLASTQAQSMIQTNPCLTVAEVIFLMKFCTFCPPPKHVCPLLSKKVVFTSSFHMFPKMCQACLNVHLLTSDSEFCSEEAGKLFLTWFIHKGIFCAATQSAKSSWISHTFLAILPAVVSERFIGLPDLSLTSTIPVCCHFLITLRTKEITVQRNPWFLIVGTFEKSEYL